MRTVPSQSTYSIVSLRQVADATSLLIKCSLVLKRANMLNSCHHAGVWKTPSPHGFVVFICEGSHEKNGPVPGLSAHTTGSDDRSPVAI